MVDEAEELPAEAKLEGLLVDPERSALLVFADPGQSGGDGARDFSEFPATYSLTVNYRNTRSIAEVVQRLGVIELDPHPRAPEGEPPSVHAQPGPQKARAQIDQLVRRLVENNGVPIEKIVLLAPNTASCLAGANEIGGVAITSDPERRSERVLLTTIADFKGLESDVVILVDIDDSCDRRTRYLASSRAKLVLHVFTKSDVDLFAS